MLIKISDCIFIENGLIVIAIAKVARFKNYDNLIFRLLRNIFCDE